MTDTDLRNPADLVTYSDAAPTGDRNWQQALWRGFKQQCPHCGESRMYRAYLKPLSECEACGEELHHHRADDAPPYVTIFIVAHIVGPLMLFGHDMFPDMPAWLDALIWCSIALIMCLWLLPRVKGALIGLQWALRMHGFETARTPPGRQPA